MTGGVMRAVVGAWLVVGAALGAQAQAGGPSTGPGGVAPSDTGRMLPGRVDFSRYATPAQCVAAVTGMARRTWRIWHDTLPYDPAHDTLPPAAVATARQCGGRFAVDNTPARDLLDLMLLAVDARDAARLDAVVRRRLSLAPTPAERGNVLLELVEAHLFAHPVDTAAALAALSRLDALGDAAIVPRLRAYNALEDYAWGGVQIVPLADRAVDSLEAFARRLSPADRDDWRVGLNALAFRWPSGVYPDPLPGALRDVRRALAIQNGHRGPVRSDAELDALARRYAMPAELARPLFVDSVPAFPGTYWFTSRGPDTTGPRVRELRGRTTLIVSLPDYDRADIDWRNGGDFWVYGVIRRLARRYAKDGLNVIVATKIMGYGRGTGPLAPAQEAEAARRFFLDQLHLPVTLVVAEAPVSRRPDGRVDVGAASYASPYVPGGAYLVGPDGKLKMFEINAHAYATETALDRAITRVLSETPKGGLAGGPTAGHVRDAHSSETSTPSEKGHDQ